ncbi:hypothetical protein [Streptomyces niveus]|uniref:hypothetical protein n=1 Tax=Streptomyces niveus TaxID=193462 RepID=UPI0033EC2706
MDHQPATNPYEYITKAQLDPDPESPWIGQTVHGPHRTRYVVQRVYRTPFGADVALCLEEHYKALRLEATDMLSTPQRPAARRTAYLRNYRRLLDLHGLVGEGKATPRTHRAIARRSAFWEQFLYARIYVEAALLEQVKNGDRLVTSNGVQMTVLDADAARCPLKGWRTHMRVEIAPERRDLADRWNWDQGQTNYFIQHEGWGLLPTLDMV